MIDLLLNWLSVSIEGEQAGRDGDMLMVKAIMKDDDDNDGSGDDGDVNDHGDKIDE